MISFKRDHDLLPDAAHYSLAGVIDRFFPEGAFLEPTSRVFILQYQISNKRHSVAELQNDA